MTRQRYKICIYAALMIVFSCLVQVRVFSQAAAHSGWSFVNNTGEIILTRDGKRTLYQNDSPRLAGILLVAGDMAQTGKGAAELHLLLNGTRTNVILTLSENTSVIIDKLADEISMEMLYGKLRIQSPSALSIKTGNSSVYFRECDAELYYIAKPGIPHPALIINCFRGDGELTANAASGPEGARFAIKSEESLSLEYRIPFAYLERKSLSGVPQPADETARAGQYNTFPEEPGRAVGQEEQNSPQELLLNAGNDFSGKKDKAAKIKNGTLITGLLFFGIGSAMQGYSYIANPPQDLRNNLFYGAYGPIGLGALFLIIAAAYKAPARTAH